MHRDASSALLLHTKLYIDYASTTREGGGGLDCDRARAGGGDGVPSRKRFLRRGSVIVPLSAVSTGRLRC